MKILLSPLQKIVLSALIGLLAALGAWRYLAHQEKKIKNHYTMTTVLQARKYIKEGRSLEPDAVDEVPIPVAYLPPTALQKKSDLVEADGRARFAARIGLLKGEPISKSKLIETGAMRGLAWTLSPGQTALSIKLNPEQAVAGLVRPGDAVHVYCTVDQQPGWPKDRTRLLLERVLVLAVDQTIWDPAVPSSVKPNQSGVPPENLLITLALSAQEAGLAALAADKGRLTLALASPLDSQTHFVRPLELLDLR